MFSGAKRLAEEVLTSKGHSRFAKLDLCIGRTQKTCSRKQSLEGRDKRTPQHAQGGFPVIICLECAVTDNSYIRGNAIVSPSGSAMRKWNVA